MDLQNIGGAVTSYLTAAVAISFEAGPIVLMGFALLVVRLTYEFLRLVKYIMNWRKNG